MNSDFVKRMKMESENKVRSFRLLNRVAKKGETVFAGSSLMEQFPVNELMMSRGMSQTVYNRGIGGFTTKQYLEVLDACVLELEPSRLFINIGTNDIGATTDWKAQLIDTYRKILTTVQTALPDCRIYVMAYYPVANTGEVFLPPNAAMPRTLPLVQEANAAVEALAGELGLTFINVNAPISDETGHMDSQYAKDPVHMFPSAYDRILTELEQFL